MKIEEAKICLDCDEIYEGTSFCPNCSGRIGWPLKEWIGTIGRETGTLGLRRTSTADLLFGDRFRQNSPGRRLFVSCIVP